jgi:DNA-directed RNA polymerase beta subunit
MAFQDPESAFDNIMQGVSAGLQSAFPIHGRTRSLVLENVRADKTTLDPHDIPSQYKARMEKGSWTVPVRGDVVLRERLTDGTLGKELSRKDVLLMDVPRMTSRLSFIHKGQEYQVSNQWQLKPGVYGRRRQNGELEARFNVTGRAAFDMTFDPETKTFEIDYKKAKLPAYPILRALGASDADLEKAWGADILRANQAVKRNATTLAQFHRTSTNGATPSSEKEVIDNLHKVMEASKLRPEVTAHTLGAPFEHVTHEALTLAGKKLISINNGAPEDDRDAIIFKTLRSTGELLQDQLKSKAQSIATKIQRQLNKEEVVSVAKALSPGTFNSAVSSLFRSSLANPAKQVNPLDMMSSAMSTTIMGPGGIKSDMQVTDEAKMIHPSHFAFVDPLATPEGCHDPLTEVFTERGWVPWPEVTEEDRFGCMVDGRMVFEFASRIVVKEHRGVLHGVETGKRPIGYRVTPQHRMWVRPLDNECLGYRFETAEEMFGKDRLFTLTHEPYLGEPKERFALDPAFSDNPIANLGSVVNVETVDYEDWGAFYGWFLSEGCVHINVPLSKYQVKLFQSYPLHAAYCQEIEGLLRRLGLPYTLMEREQGRRVYTISRKQVALLLQDQGKSSCRYIPEHFFSSPLKVRQALLDAMMKGDGRKPHQRKDGTWQMEQVYTTTSPRLAKDVDRLAATLGLPTSHRVYRDTRSSRYLPVHEIRFLRGKTKQVLKKHQRQIPYEGLVYCATVPGGLLYVRRGKGVPHWSGNSSTGVVLRLPLGVKKVGEQPHIPLYNIKTGKQEWVDPITAYTKKVVLADQVEFKDGKPHALHPEVSMMGADNKMTKGKLHEADYVLPHSSMLFNLSSAIVPFVDSDSGNRVSMAVRHMEQSISLQDRDKPLVQVVDPSGSTFEQTFGKQVAHTAPAAGKVVEVSDNHIRLKDAKGVEHKIHLYNYYPLNDTKSVLHSTPLVKVGDKVEAGQVVADNNYTREGTLALGKNLRVAYMPFHGMNFEDSLVITESAAKKLASVHLHKHEVPIAEQTIIDTKKYLQQHPGSFSNKQLTHIGEDGVVKVGAKVRPGDPMVLAMQPYSVKDRVGLGALRKSLTNQFTDKALRWDSDHEGEVVAVHRGPEGVQVHVKTIEPMQVADKMSNRHGGKGVVGYIIPDHEAPKDKDGKPVDVLFNPCYDAETEFLTERGWVKGPDLQDREVFGTLNPKTYELEYQGGETQRTPYRGPMYRLESQHLDLMVTPNHSNFVATRSPGALGTLDLSTLSPGTFRREEARDHFGKARRFLKVGRWKGEEPGWVTIPAAERGASGPASEELMFLVEDYAEFLGWFVAEGSTYRTPAGAYCVDVAQRLSANPVKYRMIEGLIRRMGLNPNPGKDGFRIFNKSLFQHLRPLGKAHEKYVPEHIQKLSPRLLKIFLDAYLLGDGNTRNEPERGHHGSRRFCTVSKKLLDGLQLVAFKQGLVVNAHPAKERGVETQRPRYDAAVGAYSKAPWSNWSKETKENQIEAWIPYEGTVYCTQVPNGTLVVRRNGKIVVSGNCGVGGRMNVGQILETMAGKVAQKTGETYKVTNFDPHNKDRVEHMQSLLKKHGISDTEELFDPKTGQSYGHVLTGPQHFIKLVHQADKKLSVRSGMGLPKLPSDEKYDSMTFQPAGGGGTGGQSYGQLGMYALLAHGATNLLREAMTVKSQGEDPETNEAKRWKTGHADAWIAMQKGLPLPPPRPTFAFHRFTELLKAAGVNMEKKGSELMLSPMTDKQILSMSKGEVVNPTAAVHAKIDPQTNHYKTIKGGLFDDHLTGGHGGTHWTHVTLTEPMPNPLFEDPIKKLTGLTKSSFESILYGHKQVLPSTGALVDKGGVTGGEGIKALLKNIDVKRELQATLAKLKKAPASSVDELYRKASYLQGLDKLGLRPEEAYILHNVPVLPPKLRPLSIMEDGALRYEDLNGFYMNIGQLNSALTRLQDMPDKVKADTRKGMYEGISALFGAHALPEGAKVKGILHQIAGSSPKEGLFQKGLLSPRQDATMRGVIIPGPDLHLDQVGLPKHAALVQYRPFVIKHMVQSGLAKTELDAQLMLSEVHQGKRQEMGVWRALERAVAERPILLKRDPALHKESILAFKPVLIEGNSIKLHPLVSGGFNADHDGDSCLGEVTYLQVSEQTTEVRQVNLADFPRLEDTKKTTGSVDVYQTPAGIYVMGNWLGRTQPCLVTEYSVHRDLKMVVVGLGNRQKVKCSQDHSLATLNPRTLLIERTSPADALGRAVPLVSLNQGHLTDTIACGGVLYQATADLGRQLGGLWASPVRELGSGWGEILPDILQKALALPLIFRKAFVREVLSERLDRTSGEVLTSDGKERSELSWLLSSCGLASRIRDHKLKLDLLTLLRAEWLSIPGKHLCTWADRA